MNIKFEFDTDSITQTEHDALVAFLQGLAVRQPVNVLAVTQVQGDIEVGMTITGCSDGIVRTIESVHTGSDSSARELEQLTKDVADTQLTAAPAPAAPAPYTPPTDLAAIFGGAPASGKPVWPFPTEAEQPAGPASPATPAAPAVQLDKNGLPWDARIHASSKAINADGSWRAKKMVDAAVVATVEAELRATMGAPAATTHGSPELDADAAKLEALAGAGSAGLTMPQPYVPLIPPAQPASPVAAPAPAPTPAAPATTGDPNTDLPTFLKEATTLINAGRATTADMIAAANSAGIPHPGALTQRPDLIATVRAAFLAKVAPVAAV
jgi:hypothetical protein